MNKVPILYEDNHIIVVEKPVNVLSQADSTKDLDLLSMIKDYLKEKYHKPGNVYLGLVHRLDRPVGGLMVFAKTSKAASRLSKEIREHRFKKVYYAIVHGELPSSGTFEDYLYKTETKDTIIDSKRGKYSKLTYEVVSYHPLKKLTLVRVYLETGRHHQIRVQFASRGHSLSGDQKYGTRGRGKQLALWAYSLSFIHPVTKKELIFEDYPELIGSWKILEGINKL